MGGLGKNFCVGEGGKEGEGERRGGGGEGGEGERLRELEELVRQWASVDDDKEV